MSFTYDLSTDVGKIRLLIPDTVSASAVFSDEELTALLALESASVRSCLRSGCSMQRARRRRARARR